MSLMDKFWGGIAKTRNKTIVLPEGEDERTIDAANAIAENGLCNVILLGDEAEIKKRLSMQKAMRSDVRLSSLQRVNIWKTLPIHIMKAEKQKG